MRTVIRGGLVVDGSGRPAIEADVAIEDDKIVEVASHIDDRGADVVDADGLVVAPGFVDIHTHYDAQILWDPDLTPSCWHGVTSVVMGNCGFGIAPTRVSDRSLVIRTLENVEGMSAEALEEGIAWSFESFPEYLGALDRREKRLNVGAMIGHTPLRFFVMGGDATEREATDDELDVMERVVGEALTSGALGFATSRFGGHIGEHGTPVPSRIAAVEEVHRLVGPLKTARCGSVQVATGPGLETPEDLAGLSRASARPVTWAGYFTGNPNDRRSATEVLEATAGAGADVWPQISCRPLTHQLNLIDPFPFESLPAFRELLALPRTRRRTVYTDPAWIERAGEQVNARRGSRWPMTSIQETSVHEELVGVPMTELADRRGLDPWRTMVELSLAEDLQTRFLMVLSNDDEADLAVLLRSDRTLVGVSDAGAHASQLCDACYPTYLLGHWVRENGTLTLEQGVRHLTSVPAGVFGLDGRGGIARGMYADLTIFDPSTVDCGPMRRIDDLPGGAERLVVDAVGVELVWVNGELVVDHGELMQRRPGQLLHSVRR